MEDEAAARHEERCDAALFEDSEMDAAPLETKADSDMQDLMAAGDVSVHNYNAPHDNTQPPQKPPMEGWKWALGTLAVAAVGALGTLGLLKLTDKEGDGTLPAVESSDLVGGFEIEVTPRPEE